MVLLRMPLNVTKCNYTILKQSYKGKKQAPKQTKLFLMILYEGSIIIAYDMKKKTMKTLILNNVSNLISMSKINPKQFCLEIDPNQVWYQKSHSLYCQKWNIIKRKSEVNC